VRRITAIGLAAVLLAAGCSGDDGGGDPDDAEAAPPTTTAEADDGATVGPLVSGTASIVDGTYVWTDYAYDDRGPNLDEADRTDLDAAGGDASYPEGWRNDADLIQLQLGAADGGVTVRAVFETLTDPTVPVVVLGFDTDGDATTGEDSFGDDWSVDGGIGAEEWVVVHDPAVDVPLAVDAVEAEDVVVDPATNTIDATIPLDPGDARWNAVAVTATVPEQSVDPTLELHDLAFVGDEPEYRWQDDIQADVLAGQEDVANAIAEIDFGQLAEQGTELTDAATPGFHTYLYESELDLGEGVAPAPAPEDGLEYRGPYQPYLVWIPDEGTEPGEPMTLFLHGLTQNHLGSVLSPDGSYLGTGRPLSEEIHHLGEYARDGLDFAPHNLTVWPLARGEGLGYRGIAEQDSLDVLADASERFAPDPDRIILSGGSMGGIGAFRLGALHPDLFSVAAPLIGLATDETQDLLGNFWNLPIRQINGLVDPLIPAEAATLTTDRLDQLELAYRAWMLDQRGHEAGGFVYDCVNASLPEFERVALPADVRYTVDPATFVSDPESGLALSYDGAYWISGMEVADLSTIGSILAFRSDGEDARSYEIVHVDRRGASGPDGGDLCGPNPDVDTDDTWRERAVERRPHTSEPSSTPNLALGLGNLAAVSVAIGESPLVDGGTITVVADGPGEITFTGLPAGTSVTIGTESDEAGDDGMATVAVPEGQTSGTFG
jgi:predicted esterase